MSAAVNPTGRLGDNRGFRTTLLTWMTLGLFLLLYPAISLVFSGAGQLAQLEDISAGMLAVALILTVVIQWGIFLINYVAIYLEGTGLRGVGLGRLRALDFAWAAAFLLASWLIMTGLAWLLTQLGYPPTGDIKFLIPQDAFGRVVWVFVSFTAGFCEEVGFRGYLMTRLKIIGRFKGWTIPSLIAGVAFGICHAYQGIPGFVLTFAFGLLFSALYVRTGRLWPCIIAHFFWDLGALFYPFE